MDPSHDVLTTDTKFTPSSFIKTVRLETIKVEKRTDMKITYQLDLILESFRLFTFLVYEKKHDLGTWNRF